MSFDFIVQIKDALITFVQAHPDLIVPVVFALGLAESIPLISFFVPSTVLFLGIGALHQAAGGAFTPIWLAGGLGAFAGDLISYAIGWYFRDDIVRVWPFSRRPELIPRAKTFFETWGAPGIVGSKFLGMLRSLVPVVAGAVRMPLWIFVPASAVSGLVWAGAFLAPGFGITLLGK